MKQLYPNPDDLAHAQDSIQKQLDTFEDKLWVPTLEQLAAEREKREALEAGLAADQDSTALATAAEEPKKTRVSTSSRGKKTETRPAKVKRGKTKTKTQKAPKTTTAPRRSVRDRKR